MLSQTTNLNGSLNRIALREVYGIHVETAVKSLEHLVPIPDSAVNPPLSEIELADIVVAEREFASGETEIFDDAESFIVSLHATRRRQQQGNQE